MSESRDELIRFHATRPDYSDKSNVGRFWELACAATREERIQREETDRG